MKSFIAQILVALSLGMVVPAFAQYSPPVRLPEIGPIGANGNSRIEVGLAVDASGSAPYPAIFSYNYVSDGTPEGTRLRENGPIIADMAAIPDGIGAYIIGTDKDTPTSQLFYTDGTESGTHIVSELIPAFPEGIRKIHGFVDGSIVVETNTDRLVVSDGTIAGTHTILPSGPTAEVEHVSLGLTQGFVSAHDANGNHIWRFGTTAGSTRDLTPAVAPPFSTQYLVAIGDRACFDAGQNSLGATLYCTDGTTQGTIPITTSLAGQPFGLGSFDPFQKFGAHIMFAPVWKPDPTSPDTFLSPWSTDGTPEGTNLLVQTLAKEYSSIGTADGRVFFSAYFQSTGWPFWKSRGNPETTEQVSTSPWKVAGAFSGDHFNPTLDSAVFFTSVQQDQTRLHRSDGTESGTFEMPRPVGVPPEDWSPEIMPKPVILGTRLLVSNGGSGWSGIWSYDLDGVFVSTFD